MRTLSWIGFGAGVAGAGLGIALHATAPAGDAQRDARSAPATKSAAIVITPDFAGVQGVF